MACKRGNRWQRTAHLHSQFQEIGRPCKPLPWMLCLHVEMELVVSACSEFHPRHVIEHDRGPLRCFLVETIQATLEPLIRFGHARILIEVVLYADDELGI